MKIHTSRSSTPLENYTHPKSRVIQNVEGSMLARNIERYKIDEELRKIDKIVQECFHATLFQLESENYEPNLQNRPPLQDIAGAPYMDENSEQISS